MLRRNRSIIEEEEIPHPSPRPLVHPGISALIRENHPVIISHPSKPTRIEPDIHAASKAIKFSVEDIVIAIDEGHAVGGYYVDWALLPDAQKKTAPPLRRSRRGDLLD